MDELEDRNEELEGFLQDAERDGRRYKKQASKANKHLEEAKKKIAADHAEIDSLKKRLASSDRCIRDFQGLAEREEGIRERERQLDEREAGAR
ncbi:hypothetical protein CF335_g3333 [Tilletia laevis]|nr:hypothetical protein CF335_g3333 [Tilletia laevis]